MQRACKIYDGSNLLMDHLTAEKLNNGVAPSAPQRSSGTLMSSFVAPCVSMGIAAPVGQGLLVLYSAIRHIEKSDGLIILQMGLMWTPTFSHKSVFKSRLLWNLQWMKPEWNWQQN